jgi:hypothetical protein
MTNRFISFAATPLFITIVSFAYSQMDTINTSTAKLNIKAFHAQQHTYAVYWEDSLGNPTSTPDLWKRSVQSSKDASGKSVYLFEWRWYQKDSLYAHIRAAGELATLKPIWHYANYFKRGKFTVSFNDNVVTIPDTAQTHPRQRDFKVILNPPAFEFSLDLELFALLPFKKTGQQFALAFYEPGSKESHYYKLTVMGKDSLTLAGSASIGCWLLRIDYASDSYATFWISDKPREVLKMKEYYKGKYRIKVKLY